MRVYWDSLDDEEIAARFAVQPGGAVLTSRLLDGRAVVMNKAAMGKAVQEKIHALDAQGCDIIALLYTGEFHGLTTQRTWLMDLDLILPATQTALVGQRRAGIMLPLVSQLDREKEKWRGLAVAPLLRWPRLIPPLIEEVAAAARSLTQQGAEVILTDCMSYTTWHKDICAREAALPVLLWAINCWRI